MKRRFRYGGQAVIEGVMMRGPEAVATCVRARDGRIAVHREEAPVRPARGLVAVPVLRGIRAVWQAFFGGVKSLAVSAELSGEEVALSEGEIRLTAALAALMGAGLFFLAPAAAAQWLPEGLGSIEKNLLEGLLRLVLFLGYLWAVSRRKEIGRVFAYHGAEHKAIFCAEKGLPLTVEHVRAQSRFHPRCGTNFLMVVMLFSLFAFLPLGWPDLWLRLASRLALLPLIAGLAYEWVMWAADSSLEPVRFLNRPGLMLERLTTREPQDDQIEVAIAALQEASRSGA